MPELPEVEFARRSLVRWFDGHSLVKAEADAKARTFRGSKPADFEALRGTLKKAQRRGKYLMLTFSHGRGVVAHLGMTGKFVKRAPSVNEPYSRAKLFLDSGEVIHFRDPRLFGRIEPMRDDELATNATIRALGHDPLVDGLTPEQLKASVAASRQDLKVALMDQSRIAGLGNIHAAEALFRAKLHPARKPATLTDREWADLARAIHTSIAFALETDRQSEEIQYVEEGHVENPFIVYGRSGEPCPTCTSTLAHFDQGGRTTYYCPHCQPSLKAKAPKKRPTAKKKASPAKKPPAARRSRR
jgi:formamidopyrimidine-DNA glycosylase